MAEIQLCFNGTSNITEVTRAQTGRAKIKKETGSLNDLGWFIVIGAILLVGMGIFDYFFGGDDD